MAAACAAAQVSTIVTSRKFVEAGNLEDDIKLLSERCRIIYLEDIRAEVELADKLYGLFARVSCRTPPCAWPSGIPIPMRRQ